MALVNCSMLRKLALFRVLRWKMPNQISTWFSQLALVGVKWKVTFGCLGQPVLVLLVRIQVVKDDVDLPVGGLVGNHLVHEGLEVCTLLGLRGLAANDSSGELQGGKEVDRTVALVGPLHALDNLAAAGLHVAARALKRLDPMASPRR